MSWSGVAVFIGIFVFFYGLFFQGVAVGRPPTVFIRWEFDRSFSMCSIPRDLSMPSFPLGSLILLSGLFFSTSRYVGCGGYTLA